MRAVFESPLSAFTEASLSSEDSAYLAQVRSWTQRLGRRDGDAGAADALADLHDVVDVDVDVPVVGVRRSTRLTKRSVKALTGWYLRYLAQQLTVQARAVERLGTALVDEADRSQRITASLSTDVAALTQDVSELDARVAALERRPGQ